MRKSQSAFDHIPNISNSSQPVHPVSTMEHSKNQSKTRDMFKKIFSRKSRHSQKSYLAKESYVTKAIAQSTLDMFIDVAYATKEDVAPIMSSNSTGNLLGTNLNHSNFISESTILCTDICRIGKEAAPIASVESLDTNASSIQSSDHNTSVPLILEQPPTDGDDSLSPYFVTKGYKELLTIPSVERSRKSSDNDSAVDMKFKDDASDQGDSTFEKTPSLNAETKSTAVKRTDSATSWRKLQIALVWTPFIQQYARHRYPWIQIAGHQGNFKPGEQGTILKKHTGRESICLQMMSDDTLADFVPSFKGDVEFEGEKYICMQDLLAQFHMPSLMDIKMGTRTYLEEELIKAQSCPKPRKDMYEKMIEIDVNEPTEEENKLRAVIKPRYMQWRETLSSTLILGFRIEGIKKSGNKNNKNVGTQSRNFKRTRYRHEVKESLLDFIDNKADLPMKFIKRIESLRNNLEKSSFFWNHEFIGSSLLFVHDKNYKANIWMIDFGKTVPLPDNCRIDHKSQWLVGNHEDGYLFGLENLLSILKEIHSELSNIPN